MVDDSKRVEVNAFWKAEQLRLLIVFSEDSKFFYRTTHKTITGEIIADEKIKKTSDYNIFSNYSWADGHHYPYFGKSRKLLEKYWSDVKSIRQINQENYIKNLEESVKDIRLYQGTIDEVAKQLGKELELIDTGKPETFIRAEKDYIATQNTHIEIGTDLILRLEAHKLGANSIVHYQPGSSIGTPVRFKKQSVDN